MVLKLSSFFEGFFFFIICVGLLQQSSGLGSPSIGSWLHGIERKAGDLTPNGRMHRFRFLQYDDDLAPVSGIGRTRWKEWRFIPFPAAVSSWKNKIRSRGSTMAPSPSFLPTLHRRTSKGHPRPPAIPSHHLFVPGHSPAIAPMSSRMINDKKSLSPLPTMTLPQLPPNQGCTSVSCTAPLTYAPPGSPCGCVLPIEVKLRFGIPLYTFLPLVSDLAECIAVATSLNRSQVRIMGADAADQRLDKTTVLINLVPLAQMFDSRTAFFIYSKFRNRNLPIKALVLGDYEVLYVHYPGLPPSPLSTTSGSTTVNVQPFPGGGDDDGPIKPMGVYVPRRRKNDSSKSMVIIVILSSVTAFVACGGFLLLLLSKCGFCGCLHKQDRRSLSSSGEKISGLGSQPSSASMSSFNSSLMAYTGAAKIFSVEDIERATDRFNMSRILGEGGFGIVYGGTLDDGRNVAVKVLKRDDQQGSREFLAEVEMLGRLHHRNLVMLIGICPEDHRRCLVYELVPNGSLDSHLHGADKETGTLDWCARMKIALGSARGLAYLHEDSSPRVIHRDFKSSNILLENDYTPKVSDFGLARAAMDERSKHISTHVMGTFGYLAPEYAMTGHLLVKSDVYSYGVVLLELLTGRKPVDMSRPPGQENLVSWARPLLATRQGTETIIDPDLKPGVPVDSFAKVAAIASTCVQPEVSHRPFMGEVVQALKLVCDEFEETRDVVSRTCSSRGSEGIVVDDLEKCESTVDSCAAISATDLQSASFGFQRESESFRRLFNSAPLKVARTRSFWRQLRGLSRGSASEPELSSTL
ncbi:receptor-like serine/threonine-protein kinase ALE2 isoform X3 [Andrographis paniculata]|uniref:receptor-like serine/threonine-protein kinase ALE2 isoform X3 n=1 Tax=Andrographis paniculata TaxID=175694 RepID=UPI0021E914DE|nr:receptor-like serine/threonine-protein kinase ALE2 isoform X3 [Andrographis paniculata]